MKALLIIGLSLAICTVEPLWVNFAGVVMMGIALTKLTHAERGHQGKPCQESNCGDKTLNFDGRHRCLPPLREAVCWFRITKDQHHLPETRTD